MQTINTKLVSNQTELLATIKELVLEHYDASGAKYVFVPHATYKALVQQTLVDERSCVGSRICTFDEWVCDRWELFGDGRVLVTQITRHLLLYEVVLNRLGSKATTGMIAILEKLIDQAYNYLLEHAHDEDVVAVLSGEQQEILDCLWDYQKALSELNLCEKSEALTLLVKTAPTPALVIHVGSGQSSYVRKSFLEALAEKTRVYDVVNICDGVSAHPERNQELTCLLNHIFKPCDAPLEPHGALQFLLPMGKYATPALLSGAISDAVVKSRSKDVGCMRVARDCPQVCVSMKNPQDLFANIASVLLDQGITVQLSDTVAFADTALGQALESLVELFYGKDQIAVAVPTDFILSSFSDISPAQAHELNAKWRLDRTVTVDRICEDIKSSSSFAERVITCLEQADWDGLFDALDERIRQLASFDDAWLTLQQKSLMHARTFVEACRTLHKQPEDYWELLSLRKISRTIQTKLPGTSHQDTADVIFTTLERVSQSAECCYSCVIIGDLTAHQYPVRSREDSADTLLEVFGVAQAQMALQEAREVFFQALASARDTVMLERVLFDEASDEAYPAVMFEEVVDCYRMSDAFDAAINKQTGLPCALDEVVHIQPEDQIYKQADLFINQNTDAASARSVQSQDSWALPSTKVPTSQAIDLVVLPRVRLEGCTSTQDTLPRLSASALENYLECPYKWFASSRLSLGSLDAGFGPVEMGTFSHALLKEFYEVFRGEGYERVTPDNLSEAQKLLSDLFEKRLVGEYEKSAYETPLIARTEIERIELLELKKRLCVSLERQSRLLPGFTPRHFEYSFGMNEDVEVKYAGCILRGSIDRIDINDAGQAVVIDYKSSIKTSHQLGVCSEVWQACGVVLPNKIQSLVYAQIARKYLGLDVVGALYLSLGNVKKDADSLAGAFDHIALGSTDLLGLSADKAAVPGKAATDYGVQSFTELLDHVEAGIEKAVQSMLRGEISPQLRSKHEGVCMYCPVKSCELRDQR